MLDDLIRLVKGQVRYYRDQIDRFPPSNPRRREGQVEMYERLLAGHLKLLAYLQSRNEIESSAPNVVAEPPLMVRPSSSTDDDLSDLPSELLEQLSSRTKRGPIDPLIQIINERGGTASLDDILIDLFRKHRELSTRGTVSNKLYRLSKQGVVRATEGKKGVYTTALD